MCIYLCVLFSEYEDPAFKLEKDYILLAQNLEGYFSVLIQNCIITDQEPNKSTLQVCIHVHLFAWSDQKQILLSEEKDPPGIINAFTQYVLFHFQSIYICTLQTESLHAKSLILDDSANKPN